MVTVKISEVTADKDGNITNDTTLSTASKEMKESITKSKLSIKNQYDNKLKAAGDKAQANINRSWWSIRKIIWWIW